MTVREYHDPTSSTQASCVRHAARYAFAAEMLEGVSLPDGCVIDCACGSGYGTEFLHEVMDRRVIGVDRSTDAITTAFRRRHHSGPTHFVADIERADRWLPHLPPIAAVVCIETLEHLTQGVQVAWVREVAEHLEPGGAFLVMCPVKAPGERSGPNPDNPWHLHEPTLEELDALLYATFDIASAPAPERYQSTSGPAWQATRLCVKS